MQGKSNNKTSAVKEVIHPKAAFDSESNMDDGEVDRVADTPITIQDTFIFCPMAGTFVLNETLKQGIFASENEMSQLEDTKKKLSSIDMSLSTLKKKMQTEAK